jgi:hypothetical protein
MATPNDIAHQLIEEAQKAYDPRRSDRFFWGKVSTIVRQRKLDQPIAYSVAKSLRQLGYDNGNGCMAPVLEDLHPDLSLEQLQVKIAFCLCAYTCDDFTL